MESEELRKKQAPLKTQYRENPESALKNFKSEGIIGDNVNCILETKHGTINAGLHTASGGNGNEICSGDLLLESLVACSGVTLAAVATAFGVDIKGSKVEAEGQLDFRGTLGVSRDVPVGFKSIILKFIIKSDVSQDTLDKLLNLTERYCVVYQTLKSSTEIETILEKI